MNDSMQVRGNCQCCGRDQAVMRGTMSKHGYDVQLGYFRGVCNGDRHKPMQVDRSVTDAVAAAVRQDADRMEARADRLESGRETLGLVVDPSVYVRKGEEPTKVEWSALNEWKRADVLKSIVWNLRSTAKAARGFAADLVKVADQVHGTPLREVERAEAPAPILKGERRMMGDTVVIARCTDRGRVYWLTEAGRKGWTGTAAWRRLETAA